MSAGSSHTVVARAVSESGAGGLLRIVYSRGMPTEIISCAETLAHRQTDAYPVRMLVMPVREPWMVDKACAGRTDEMFLDVNGARITRADRLAIDRALAICASCPVREQCADWAIHEPDAIRVRYCVVGGMTPGDLNRARKTKAAQRERRYRHRPKCGSVYAYNLHVEFGEDCAVCKEAKRLRAQTTRPSRACA